MVATAVSPSTVKMTARYAGQCVECDASIAVGQWIEYNPTARRAAHVECPPMIARPLTDVGRVAEAADTLMTEYERWTASAAGESFRIANAADDLLNAYDALKADQERIASSVRRDSTKTMTRKAIYRVSLTGGIKRYGVDVVNVALTPDARYGSVKVSEYRGESIGVVKRDGHFMYWGGIDHDDQRVQAIRAAVDVILTAADPIEYAKAFAVESQACMRCGDDLVDEKSRERLLGPVCFKAWSK